MCGRDKKIEETKRKGRRERGKPCANLSDNKDTSETG